MQVDLSESGKWEKPTAGDAGGPWMEKGSSEKRDTLRNENPGSPLKPLQTPSHPPRRRGRYQDWGSTQVNSMKSEALAHDIHETSPYSSPPKRCGSVSVSKAGSGSAPPNRKRLRLTSSQDRRRPQKRTASLGDNEKVKVIESACSQSQSAIHEIFVEDERGYSRRIVLTGSATDSKRDVDHSMKAGSSEEAKYFSVYESQFSGENVDPSHSGELGDLKEVARHHGHGVLRREAEVDIPLENLEENLENSEDSPKENHDDKFYNVLNLAIFQFLRPEDVILVRQVSMKWRKRLNNTPLLLCSVWETLPYDVFWAMRKNELRDPIPAGSVGSLSPELNPAMLHTLFKWIIDLALDYRMSLQTVFCACVLVYRVLSKIRVSRRYLQRLGMVAFLLGAKIHERQPPLVSECVEACAQLYPAEDIRATEIFISKRLSWSFHSPTVYTFVMHLLDNPKFKVHPSCHCLAVYLCELTLTDWELADVVPSKLSLVLVSLAQYTYGLDYSQTILMSGYNRSHLADSAQRMLKCWNRYAPGSNERTVLSELLRSRYVSKEMGSVSLIRPPPGFLDDFLAGIEPNSLDL
mmetsp:Transcript_13729/g.26055  ORF Transcript_13729/g.26055 Transcript_13729/m.26055 type:complete len:579 (-) Transcript_13729:536-2272(-)|eukprot:CAMPEP_0167782950 /NCGR_PEP_ID=MMETSP0111_2-20121227/6804_1 /TAXON_ID=91324 /ORGANISM="Lotharella globosa, Strain CCCM811" /LENGTH=578 /DNA_ID=CAMNT_0007673843 /DNA_START=130 /DNA_END=1866 /DNA_ORIENTATION=+